MDKCISRKDFLVQATGVLATAGSISSLTGCSPRKYSKDKNKPNIILITADDLGWKDISCYGNLDVKTPHIDRLAREGVKFQNAFVVTSSCAPSRASLITGQYPHTNGVTALAHIHKTKSLSPFHLTLADLLSEAGYNTALMGKWHVSPYLPTSWYGYQERLSGIFGEDFWIKDIKPAVDFIHRNKDNRFYLELNFMHNHRDMYGEFTMDPDFPVDPEKIKVPEYYNYPQWPEIKADLAKYFSQTKKMDKMVGDVLNTLDNLGLAENTMVVFISDNGPPYPGLKMTSYERGIRTPLLIRYPAKIKKSEQKAMVESIDLMPTILEGVGIPVPDSLEGKSFWPAIAGNPGGYTEKEEIFTEMTAHVEYIPTRSVRTRKYKYIRNYSNIAFGLDQNAHMEWAHRLVQMEDQPWTKPRLMEELYDIENDPNERKNLVYEEKYADILQDMRSRLDAQMKKTKDFLYGKAFTYDYNAGDYVKVAPGTKYK